MRVYFVLLQGGTNAELARHEANSDRAIREGGDYTDQMIDWLRNHHIELNEGDSIKIEERG